MREERGEFCEKRDEACECISFNSTRFLSFLLSLQDLRISEPPPPNLRCVMQRKMRKMLLLFYIQWYLDITYSDIANSVLNPNPHIEHNVILFYSDITNSCYYGFPVILGFVISGYHCISYVVCTL